MNGCGEGPISSSFGYADTIALDLESTWIEKVFPSVMIKRIGRRKRMVNGTGQSMGIMVGMVGMVWKFSEEGEKSERKLWHTLS